MRTTPPREPPSSVALSEAMSRLDGLTPGASRAAGRYVVAARLPDPRQPGSADPWLFVDRCSSLEQAMDAATFPATQPPLPMGSLVRVALGGYVLWRGVMTDRRETTPERPMPTGARTAPYQARGWLEAWEGQPCDARWMIGQCVGVSRRRVVRAVVGCIRTLLPDVPKRRIRPAMALDEIERSVDEWPPSDRVLRDLRWWEDSLPDDLAVPMRGGPLSRGRTALDSSVRACVLAARVVRAEDDVAAVRAASEAIGHAGLRWTGRRRDAMSEAVRREIPLGFALLAEGLPDTYELDGPEADPPPFD